jgi:hypothetical protein
MIPINLHALSGDVFTVTSLNGPFGGILVWPQIVDQSNASSKALVQSVCVCFNLNEEQTSKVLS